jgi:hypothetical protein
LIENHCEYEITDVRQIAVHHLFFNLPKFIQFLSVDTEGSELEIFENIDFSKYKFEVITYENNGDHERRIAINNIFINNSYFHVKPINSEDDAFIYKSL